MASQIYSMSTNASLEFGSQLHARTHTQAKSSRANNAKVSVIRSIPDNNPNKQLSEFHAYFMCARTAIASAYANGNGFETWFYWVSSTNPLNRMISPYKRKNFAFFAEKKRESKVLLHKSGIYFRSLSTLKCFAHIYSMLSLLCR